jgi:hypothetical protein
VRGPGCDPYVSDGCPVRDSIVTSKETQKLSEYHLHEMLTHQMKRPRLASRGSTRKGWMVTTPILPCGFVATKPWVLTSNFRLYCGAEQIKQSLKMETNPWKYS